METPGRKPGRPRRTGQQEQLYRVYWEGAPHEDTVQGAIRVLLEAARRLEVGDRASGAVREGQYR